MNRKKFACIGLLTSFAMGALALNSEAHAPVASALPLRHAATALRLLAGKNIQNASFNHLTRALLYNRVPGYSGSSSALYKQTKSIAGTGIFNGIKARFNGQPIASGSYYGTAYEDYFGTSSQSFPQIYLALGSNSFNNTVPGSVYSIVNPSTVFTYSKNSFASEALAKQLQSIKNVAVKNPVFALQLNSLKEGEKIATTGLSGGFLSGQNYEQGGSSFTSYSRDVYTFGSNPYNTGIYSTASNFNGYNSPSYLTFLNKINIPISSGQFAGAVLEGNPLPPFTNVGNFLFALGKNPYNNNINNYVLSAAVKYLSYLKY